jgi:transposase-like protein
VKLSIRPRPWLPPTSAFAGFRFPAEVIVVAVRWYLRYSLIRKLVPDRAASAHGTSTGLWP